MDQATVQGIYDRLMMVNEEAFGAGLFNAAYHALAGALHSAEYLEEEQGLLAISERARKQNAEIDRRNPQYEHSTQSAAKRGQSVSIFTKLAMQAETMAKMKQTDRKWEKTKNIVKPK